MVLVEPTSLDAKLRRHLMQILNRVWNADQVPMTIAGVNKVWFFHGV
jgi:hypothetical protein